MRKGGNSQDRRRARRAAGRRAPVVAANEMGFDELVAAATGSTSLPLSDQAKAWDSTAADKRVRAWAGATDAPNAKYGRAFFYKNGDGKNFGDYKLGYADVVDGNLVAVWRGVTAVAGVLQGARGGVEGLSDAERSSVKSKVEGYYSKAAKEYGDDSIEVPWKGETSEAETATFEQMLAFAVGDVAWGPEDGFIDLLCDVNELLEQVGDDPYGSRYRAVDVGVNLDKVLICDYSDESKWSAPITIDKDGEPVLSPQTDWVPVDDALVEVAPDEAEDDEDGGADEAAEGEMSRAAGTFSAARIRFELRDIVLTADAGGDVVDLLPDEHKPGAQMPKRRPGAKEPDAPTPPAGASNEIGWQAIFVPEGSLTDDGRAFAPGSLSWRELPLSLMAMTETSAQGGHDGAVLAGRIDRIWREGNLVMAEGVFDKGEFGAEVARMVGDQTLRGLSVDTAIHEFEVGPRSDYFTDDGEWRTETPTRAEGDDPQLADLLFGDESEDRIFVVTSAVIGMATVCPFPAFAGASVSLVASGGGAVWRYSHQGGFTTVERPLALAAAAVESESLNAAGGTATVAVKIGNLYLERPDGTRRDLGLIAGAAELLDAHTEPVEDGLTASAAGHAPLKPPAAWFQDPELEQLTPLMIDEDGRVFGHAWSWDSCHISFPDACVLAPHTETENAYFHLGEIECEGGERLAVGKVTLDAPHAGARLSRADATAHYDHTGTVAGHVVCGEDEFGGWVSGAIAPDLSEEKLRLLRGSALSGDWRNVNGNLELVALLAVNVPGFPVPRPRVLVAAGADGTEERLALTAAGIVLEGETPCEVVADIEGLAAEVGAEPVDEFAALLEQAEA